MGADRKSPEWHLVRFRIMVAIRGSCVSVSADQSVDLTSSVVASSEYPEQIEEEVDEVEIQRQGSHQRYLL